MSTTPPRRGKLTPLSPSPVNPQMSIQAATCAFIRQGAFPKVAATAAGLLPEQFDAWLTRGQRTKKGPFFEFRLAVETAQAHARLKAEQALYTDDPLAWLKHGPGRDNSSHPGWSSPVRAHVHTTATQINVLANPDTMALIHKILAALAAYPDAHHAVTAALTDTPPVRILNDPGKKPALPDSNG